MLKYLILVFIFINQLFGQIEIENQKIKIDLENGLINPIIANSKWNNLQNKYGENPVTTEIYGWRALTFYYQGKNNEAIKLFEIGLQKAIILKNDSLHFKYLADIAGIYRYLGDYKNTNIYFDKANLLYKSNPKISKEIPQYLCAFFQNIGKFKQEIGDFVESKYYLNISNKIATEYNLQEYRSLIYGVMATNNFSMNEPELAIANLKMAIKFTSVNEVIADKFIKLADINYGKKKWQEMNSNLKKANLYFNQSEKRKAGVKFPNTEMSIFLISGKYNFGTRNYKLAEKLYSKSIKVGLNNDLKLTLRNLVQSYKYLSLTACAQQNYTAALQNLQKALQYNSTNFKSDNYPDNPKLEDLKYKNDALEIYKEKISTLLAIYKKEGKKEYLDYALSTVQSVNQLINYQRNSFQLEGSKLFLSEQAHAIYGLAIEAFYQKYLQTKDSKYLELAFKYSEANKAVVLFEAIKANAKSSFTGVPQVLIDQESVAIKNMAIYENQLYKDAKNENLWRKKLIDVTDELAKLKTRFKKDYPKYYDFKHNSETISISEVKAKLTDRQSVIEYFLNENSLFVFVITKTKVQLFKESLPENFKENTANYKNLILDKAISVEYRNLSNGIFKTLFNAKIIVLLEKEKINNLKIIGDGVINNIPLEALITRPIKSLKEVNIYLIEQFTIGYLPSATMNWKNTNLKDQKWFPDTYIGFAPTYKAGLNLPDNQANVINLANQFSGKSFLQEKASISNFNENSSKNSIILHLSMHGGASITNEMESYLAFEKDSLFVHDIYTKSIPTELAILDACETGMGILNNGEGVLNLARSFLHAGSQAVAMSLWKLSSSAETAQIINDFAKLVVDGQPKDKALSQAKLNYLAKNRQDLALSHPFYWAPLIIVGNSNPIEPNYYKYWLVLFALLIAYSYSSYRSH